MAALVKNGDLIPQDGFVTKAQTKAALLKVGITPKVVTETTNANFGDRDDARIQLFKMNTIEDSFGDGGDSPAFGGREHWRSTGIRDADGPRDFVYDEFACMAGPDGIFTLDEVEAAANLWDAPVSESGLAVVPGPPFGCNGRNPFPSNDENSDAIRSLDGTPNGPPCTRDDELTRGKCLSQLQGAISFMHQEFGWPPGEDAKMDEPSMRALWLHSEYPAKFMASSPRSCSGGSLGCSSCLDDLNAATAAPSTEDAQLVQREKFCRCMENKDALDQREFATKSAEYINADCGSEEPTTRPSRLGATTGSFFGQIG